MIYTSAPDETRPYDHLPPASWPALRCAACKRPAMDHGPLGECLALRVRDKRHGQTDAMR